MVKKKRECVVCGRPLRGGGDFCYVCRQAKMTPKQIEWWKKKAKD